MFELAAWHLGSADYIADTLRLQKQFSRGQVLDFGGGIGTHSLIAASQPMVDHVWFVDLNPHNRQFVSQRAEELGFSEKIPADDNKLVLVGAERDYKNMLINEGELLAQFAKSYAVFHPPDWYC